MNNKKYINDGIESSYMQKVEEKGITSAYMQPIPDILQIEESAQITDQPSLIRESEQQKEE